MSAFRQLLNLAVIVIGAIGCAVVLAGFIVHVWNGGGV